MSALIGAFVPFILAYLWPALLACVLVSGCVLMTKNRWGEEHTNQTRISDAQLQVENDDGDECSGDHEENGHFVPYISPRRSFDDMAKAAKEFYELMNARRSVRSFSREPVPIEVIQNVIRTAGTSPSGAHTQPWTFAVISNPALKESIQEIVEAEEQLNYAKRMGSDWVRDLKKFRTNWRKPYLVDAPYLILVFKQTHSFDENNQRREHYYSEISTCISIGILLAALQTAGLAALTSTPMNAGPSIRQLLKRPSNEKLLLLIPVGFPADDCTVPALERNPLERIMISYD